MKPPRDMFAEFERRCRQEGLPVTIQRRSILQTLSKRSDHPTADQIYDEVRGRIPGLSRTTVYRVLETLVRLGVATKTPHPGAAARFDPNTDPHHHMACTRCDALIDLHDASLDGLKSAAARRAGFEVRDYSVHFRGLCPRCRTKRKRK